MKLARFDDWIRSRFPHCIYPKMNAFWKEEKHYPKELEKLKPDFSGKCNCSPSGVLKNAPVNFLHIIHWDILQVQPDQFGACLHDVRVLHASDEELLELAALAVAVSRDMVEDGGLAMVRRYKNEPSCFDKWHICSVASFQSSYPSSFMWPLALPQIWGRGWDSI